LQRKNPNIDRFGDEHRGGRPVRHLKAIFPQGLCSPKRAVRLFDAVGLVVHATAPNPARAVGCKKKVTLDEKPLQRMITSRLRLSGRTIAKERLRGAAPPMARIVDRSRLELRAHTGVIVRQMKKIYLIIVLRCGREEIAG
jgi:hypothetical protein